MSGVERLTARPARGAHGRHGNKTSIGRCPIRSWTKHGLINVMLPRFAAQRTDGTKVSQNKALFIYMYPYGTSSTRYRIPYIMMSNYAN